MKTIGILQPGYLPWLGFFEQLYRSDVFVIYDDVQYDKNGWRNRNKIKTAQGPLWLTVPVLTKGKNRQYINETIIDNNIGWRDKHLKALEFNYRKAPFFNEYFPIFDSILCKKWERLIDLDMSFIRAVAELLKIPREFPLSSTLKLQGSKMERLIKISQHFGAEVFYEGALGKQYIEIEEFEKAHIHVQFQEYEHPVYRQLFGDFLSHLSIVDLLFNHGPESLEILLGRAKT